MRHQESPDGSKRLAPRVPQITAEAAAARGPRYKKLKWRTRDQQSSQLYNLQLDLHDLRQEIKALQDYEQILRTQTLNQREQLDDYYIKRVMQYYKVFEHGYQSSTIAADAVDAVQFLEQMMDDEVAVGRFVGRDVVLDQWARYARAFPGLQCHLTRSRIASADEVTIVSATATYTFEITQTTLEMLFPRMLAVQPQIGAKLLGRQFEGVGVSSFTFDAQSHRVVCTDSHIDFFKVFAALLHDSSELCALFDGATISEEHFIGDTSVYPVLQFEDEEKYPYRVFINAATGTEEEDHSQTSSPDSYKLQIDHILDLSLAPVTCPFIV